MRLQGRGARDLNQKKESFFLLKQKFYLSKSASSSSSPEGKKKNREKEKVKNREIEKGQSKSCPGLTRGGRHTVEHGKLLSCKLIHFIGEFVLGENLFGDIRVNDVIG